MRIRLFYFVTCLFMFSTISPIQAQTDKTDKPDYQLIKNEFIKRSKQDVRKLNTAVKINKAKMYDDRLSETDRNEAAWQYITTNIKLFKSDKEIKSIWKDLQNDFHTSLCKSYKTTMKRAEDKEVFASEKILYIYLLSERKFFIEQCN